jgi:mono/diheme cytochrome c family protein
MQSARIVTRIMTLTAAVLLMTQLSVPSQAQTPQQKRGKVIAQGLCARCHAIEKNGDSPHLAAPRFRTLDSQTDLSKLARRIREGLLTGHEDMPMFRFGRDDADAMVAYIRSIETP